MQPGRSSLHEEGEEGGVGLVLQEAAEGLRVVLRAGQQNVGCPHPQLWLARSSAPGSSPACQASVGACPL